MRLSGSPTGDHPTVDRWTAGSRMTTVRADVAALMDQEISGD
jgi:hypothetical protein